MGVVERAFPGWQGQVNDHKRVVLQHKVMKRLVFNRHRRGCRRLLRNKNLKQEEKKNKTGFCDHSCPAPCEGEKRKISYTGFPEGQGIKSLIARVCAVHRRTCDQAAAASGPRYDRKAA